MQDEINELREGRIADARTIADMQSEIQNLRAERDLAASVKSKGSAVLLLVDSSEDARFPRFYGPYLMANCRVFSETGEPVPVEYTEVHATELEEGLKSMSLKGIEDLLRDSRDIRACLEHSDGLHLPASQRSVELGDFDEGTRAWTRSCFGFSLDDLAEEKSSVRMFCIPFGYTLEGKSYFFPPDIHNHKNRAKGSSVLKDTIRKFAFEHGLLPSGRSTRRDMPTTVSERSFQSLASSLDDFEKRTAETMETTRSKSTSSASSLATTGVPGLSPTTTK
jgi:hypothetical protein